MESWSTSIVVFAYLVITLVPAAHSTDVYGIDGQPLLLTCDLSQIRLSGFYILKWIHKKDKNVEEVAIFSPDKKAALARHDYQIVAKDQVLVRKLLDLKIPKLTKTFSGEYFCTAIRDSDTVHIITVYNVKGTELVLGWSFKNLFFTALVRAKTQNTDVRVHFEKVQATTTIQCRRGELDNVQVVFGQYSCLKRNSDNEDFVFFNSHISRQSRRGNFIQLQIITMKIFVLKKHIYSQDCKTNYAQFFNRTHFTILDLNEVTATSGACVMVILYDVVVYLPAVTIKPQNSHNIFMQRQYTNNKRTFELLLEFDVIRYKTSTPKKAINTNKQPSTVNFTTKRSNAINTNKQPITVDYTTKRSNAKSTNKNHRTVNNNLSNAPNTNNQLSTVDTTNTRSDANNTNKELSTFNNTTKLSNANNTNNPNSANNISNAEILDKAGPTQTSLPPLNVAESVGGVVGFFAFLLIIVIVLWCVMFKRRKNKDGDGETKIQIQTTIKSTKEARQKENEDHTHMKPEELSATAKSYVYDNNENDIYTKVNKKSEQTSKNKSKIGDRMITPKNSKESHDANTIQKIPSLPEVTCNQANISSAPNTGWWSTNDDTYIVRFIRYVVPVRQNVEPSTNDDSTKNQEKPYRFF